MQTSHISRLPFGKTSPSRPRYPHCRRLVRVSPGHVLNHTLCVDIAQVVHDVFHTVVPCLRQGTERIVGTKRDVASNAAISFHSSAKLRFPAAKPQRPDARRLARRQTSSRRTAGCIHRRWPAASAIPGTDNTCFTLLNT